jgi:hypothetical protein
MIGVDVFINEKSNADKFIIGKSSSGKINVNSIKRNPTQLSQDDLIRKVIKTSEDDKFLIVLGDNLKCLFEPKKLLDAIEYAIENIKFDLFYLSYNNDECKLQTDFRENDGVDFMKVKSAHGIDALIISPSGKEKIKNNLDVVHGRGVDYILNAMSGKILNSYSSFPTLFVPNYIKRTDDTELSKQSLCREVIYAKKPAKLSSRNTSAANVFWFIFVIIVILFFTVISFGISKTAKNSQNDEILTTTNELEQMNEE